MLAPGAMVCTASTSSVSSPYQPEASHCVRAAVVERAVRLLGELRLLERMGRIVALGVRRGVARRSSARRRRRRWPPSPRSRRCRWPRRRWCRRPRAAGPACSRTAPTAAGSGSCRRAAASVACFSFQNAEHGGATRKPGVGGASAPTAAAAASAAWADAPARCLVGAADVGRPHEHVTQPVTPSMLAIRFAGTAGSEVLTRRCLPLALDGRRARSGRPSRPVPRCPRPR